MLHNLGLTAKTVPEGSHEPKGEVLVGIRAREATMLLQDMVPHPRALCFPTAAVVAHIVIPVLLGPGVQSSRTFSMVHPIFNFIQRDSRLKLMISAPSTMASVANLLLVAPVLAASLLPLQGAGTPSTALPWEGVAPD